MPRYSHSQLATFEQCPLKFRFRYVDKIRKPDEQGVEAFTGSLVHETLQKLYEDLEYEKLNTLDGLLAWYSAEWRRTWRPEVKMVRGDLSEEDYRQYGARCLRTYYERYMPFQQSRTLGTEMRLTFDLDDAGQYQFQGYIDRLARRDDGTYEIHDYKTGRHLPSQADADADRQLGLYQYGLQARWPGAERVELIWHYVGCGETLISHRTPDQIAATRSAAIVLIDRIRATTDFEPVRSRLCEWCEYKSECPLWKHSVAVSGMDASQFAADEGVQLADAFSDAKLELDRTEQRLSDLREKLLAFARRQGAKAIEGHGVRVSITEREQLSLPGQDDPALHEAELFIRSIGKWDELSALSSSRVSAAANSPGWPAEWRKRFREWLRPHKISTLRVSHTEERDHEE